MKLNMNLSEFNLWITSIMDRRLGSSVAMQPVVSDLYSLYCQVKDLKCVAALEFGSGWSTVVIAQALKENRASNRNYIEASIRHPNAFQLLSIETSRRFLRISKLRLKSLDLASMVTLHLTRARMEIVLGQFCHLFRDIPPFTADFIYVDGPDCAQVKGELKGFTVNFGSDGYRYGLPMSADLLLLEPFMWPGTRIVLDGRGANASFLHSNFKRNWKYFYDKPLDQHLFTLEEAPWGTFSEALWNLKYPRLSN